MGDNFICFSAVFFSLLIALIAFWIWMLVDCLKNEPSTGNDKLIWVLIIVLLGGLGAVIYFLVRRPSRPPMQRLKKTLPGRYIP